MRCIMVCLRGMVALIVFASASVSAAMSEAEAVAAVKAVVAERGLYDDLPKAECLTYDIDTADDLAIEIAVREVHDTVCGGDPATSPVRDRFRVDRDDQQVRRYDPVEAGYVDWLSEAR